MPAAAAPRCLLLVKWRATEVAAEASARAARAAPAAAVAAAVAAAEEVQQEAVAAVGQTEVLLLLLP